MNSSEISPNSTPGTPLRPRLRQAMRQEVAATAIRLLVDRGFDGVTVAEIAAEAGVSRATFFRYFGGKEDAVLAAVEPVGERIAEGLGAQPEDLDPWDALRTAVVAAVGSESEDREWALARTRLITSAPSLRARELEKHHRWQGLIGAALAARLREPPDSLTVRTLAAAALAALEAATDAWAATDATTDLAALVDAAFGTLTLADQAQPPTQT
ncbi:TetR family transcriptional regulator [Phycicoccus sp. CSK15P-2]|uniref:acyl-CoA-like ligand-binding transcription factor n=1 Tax=Phycicoccus sp. CSK15P-2 TaxID=2807627 RepID=UPI0019502A7F|nr:TetR family transcriptional regulator [Phycicoccus sp. CSK15P-2]MBM6405666.1 TetR family transcriptional regulator [Phycicoccus sp. CSK15P-2]